jgi:proline iminopeptidase
MLTLYPPIKPYAVHQLTVDAIHQVYVEECGNPKGLPVVFIHGGPGMGCDADHRRFFDPSLYRIILFDQRGCGRSTPYAELENNTTALLVSDMEMIRAQLHIDKWVLFGGSWGSTLALVYAETYPHHVLSMVLRGIFLCRPKDITWFYEENGVSRLFPDYWAAFAGHLPIEERQAMLKNYYRRLIGQDEVARMAAAKAWSIWEGCCATLQPNPQIVDHFSNPHIALSLARIEAHYFINDSFLTPNQILNNADQLKGIPGVIIHGRYDVVCPLDQAYELHQSWPGSELNIIRDAGHAACELGITNALIMATNHIAEKFK